MPLRGAASSLQKSLSNSELRASCVSFSWKEGAAVRSISAKLLFYRTL
jgi:hypothetical protein